MYYYIVNINVTETYANCGSQNACCYVYKVEIITSVFKWLNIVLRLAIKNHAIKCTKFLKMRLLCPKTCIKKTHAYMSSMQADIIGIVLLLKRYNFQRKQHRIQEANKCCWTSLRNQNNVCCASKHSRCAVRQITKILMYR